MKKDEMVKLVGDSLKFIEKLPEDIEVSSFRISYDGLKFFPEATKEQLSKWSLILGTFKKEFSGSIMYLRKDFISIMFYRDLVCKRVVKEKKLVPEIYIPAHEEEVIEWDCNPILNQKEETNEEISQG